MEEVVIGHIRDTTARFFHDLHRLGIYFSGFLQGEELLHFLQSVFEHHKVASVLWAAIKLIQIVLQEMCKIKKKDGNEFLSFLFI